MSYEKYAKLRTKVKQFYMDGVGNDSLGLHRSRSFGIVRLCHTDIESC